MLPYHRINLPMIETMAIQTFEIYESVSVILLSRFKRVLEFKRVEGKQRAFGASGTRWQLDAKVFKRNRAVFLIVEVKRHTKKKISQAIVGSLVAAIRDTGAVGGLVVSPHGMQKGATMLAKANNIKAVQLTADSTSTDYLMESCQNAWRGISETIPPVRDSALITMIDSSGRVVRQQEING